MLKIKISIRIKIIIPKKFKKIICCLFFKNFGIQVMSPQEESNNLVTSAILKEGLVTQSKSKDLRQSFFVEGHLYFAHNTVKDSPANKE